MKSFSDCISAFSSYVSISSSGTPTLYNYLNTLYDECVSQKSGSSSNGLPLLYSQNNFRTIYSNYFGSDGSYDAAFDSLVGWCLALCLTEIKPTKRNDILKIGYRLGGYNHESKIYGYSFENDPNIARLVGGAIYAAMRGKLKPNRSTMRSEIGFSDNDWNSGNYDLYTGWDTSTSNSNGDNDFYINFPSFLPTAPGPNHQSSTGDTIKSGSVSSRNIPELDYDIYEYIIDHYNLNDATHAQETAQAISNKDMEVEHFFGPSVNVSGYNISSIFGTSLYSTKQDRTTDIGKFIYWLTRTGMDARHNLQGGSNYTRYRPGCDWDTEKVKHSNSNDKYNALADFEIEDGDGSKECYDGTGNVLQYYYDEQGNWTSSTIKSAADYKEAQQTGLRNNSYPSGHSSGIFCVSQTLMEMFPSQAANILSICNSFAIDRTITRYHWNSDTIIGRIIGSAINAVIHATTDYDDIINGNYSSLRDAPNLPSIDETGWSIKAKILKNGTTHPRKIHLYIKIVNPDTNEIEYKYINVYQKAATSSGTGENGDCDPLSSEPSSENPGNWTVESIWSPYDKALDADGSGEEEVVIGYIKNVTYGTPEVYGIYERTDAAENINGNWIADSGSMIKLTDITFSQGISSGGTNPGGGGSGGESGGSDGENSTDGGGSDTSGTIGTGSIGGMGTHGNLRYKKDIIDVVLSNIATIEDLEVSGLSYNAITLYSYFHTDVCTDMKKIGGIYHKMFPNYQALYEYWKTTKQWLEDLETNLNNAITEFNANTGEFSEDYYYPTISSATYSEEDGIQIKMDETGGSGRVTYYVPAFEFELPEIPEIDERFNDNPSSSQFTIAEYTYTWNKGQTYSMPYKQVNMPTELSYNPNIRNQWQTMIYTYMKWNNNQFDDHMPLIH